jgi:hypothetical protein
MFAEDHPHGSACAAADAGASPMANDASINERDSRDVMNLYRSRHPSLLRFGTTTDSGE